MEKPTINLYTSKPSDGGFKALAALLAQHQPVQLRSLDELPSPRQRSQKGGQADG